MSLVQATSSVLTGVLWYSMGQKWSLYYHKVPANRIRVIRWNLCKTKDFWPGQKIRPRNPRVCVMRVRVNEVLLYNGALLFTCLRVYCVWYDSDN